MNSGAHCRRRTDRVGCGVGAEERSRLFSRDGERVGGRIVKRQRAIGLGDDRAAVGEDVIAVPSAILFSNTPSVGRGVLLASSGQADESGCRHPAPSRVMARIALPEECLGVIASRKTDGTRGLECLQVEDTHVMRVLMTDEQPAAVERDRHRGRRVVRAQGGRLVLVEPSKTRTSFLS